MFEGFFNVVKERFNGAEEEYKPPMFKCPRCTQTSPLSRYEELHRVCPKCNYHGRLSSQERIAITVDKDSFKELLTGIDLETLDADRLFHLMYTCRYLLYRQ